MGCTSVHQVPTSELDQLDGWTARERSFLAEVARTVASAEDGPVLVDVDQDRHAFDEDTTLVFERRSGEVVEHEYRAIEVDDRQFLGVLTGEPERRLHLDRADIDSVGVRRFDAGKTLLVSGAIVLAAAVGVVALALLTGGSGEDDDGGSVPCGHGCSVDF